MTNLRKGNAFVSGTVLGVIVSMSKKNNEIVALINETEQKLAYDAEMTKISKAEYNTRMEAYRENQVEEVAVELEKVLPEKKIPVAQLARELFVEMKESPVIERKHVIRAFRETLGLTENGAKTYYYNCTVARKANKL